VSQSNLSEDSILNFRLPGQIFSSKFLSISWILLLLTAAVLLTAKYFYVKQIVADVTGQSISVAALFSELGFYLIFFVLITLVGIGVLFKQWVGGVANKKHFIDYSNI